MAGMLPGVEAARRRRFHRSSQPFTAAPGYGTGSTRRSSFCLYATSRDHHLPTSPASEARKQANEASFDESQLSAAAREAKKRLDERLHQHQHQHQRKSQKTSIMSTGNEGSYDSSIWGKIDMKKGLNWLKLRWNCSKEEECAVGLGLVWEEDEAPIAIGLAHKLHTKCLTPCINANPHCPCCTMAIPSSSIRLQIER